MHNLLLIIKREFITKVRSKAYLILIFLSPLLMIGMASAIFYFVGKEKKANYKKTSLITITSPKIIAEIQKTHPKLSVFIDPNLTFKEAKSLVDAEEYNGVVYTDENLEILEVYGDKKTPKQSLKKILERNWKIQYLKSNNIETGVINTITNPSPVHIIHVNNTKKEITKWVKGIVAIGSGYIMMMFVIIYGNAVMRSIIEEKNSKVIEIMVCTVKPYQLMLGKIIGNALAGLLQFFIWGLLLFVGLSIIQKFSPTEGGNSEKIALIFETLWSINYTEIILVFICFFVSGYLLYSSFYASVGAAVNSETDTQQFVHPILLPLMFAVYIGIVTIVEGNPHSDTAQLFTFIPFTSPIILPMRIPFGVPTWEIILSLALLLGSFVTTVFIASKIYRIGILTDGNKPSIKQLIQWVFQKI
ncbi:ABC transporter permease [Wenyingzhuangia sp. IMCC45574]